MAKAKKAKGPQQKQRANIYTMMLIVAFIALTIGSAILWMELDRYDWDTEAKDAASLSAPVSEVHGARLTA